MSKDRRISMTENSIESDDHTMEKCCVCHNKPAKTDGTDRCQTCGDAWAETVRNECAINDCHKPRNLSTGIYHMCGDCWTLYKHRTSTCTTLGCHRPALEGKLCKVCQDVVSVEKKSRICITPGCQIPSDPNNGAGRCRMCWDAVQISMKQFRKCSSDCHRMTSINNTCDDYHEKFGNSDWNNKTLARVINRLDALISLNETMLHSVSATIKKLWTRLY